MKRNKRFGGFNMLGGRYRPAKNRFQVGTKDWRDFENREHYSGAPFGRAYESPELSFYDHCRAATHYRERGKDDGAREEERQMFAILNSLEYSGQSFDAFISYVNSGYVDVVGFTNSFMRSRAFKWDNCAGRFAVHVKGANVHLIVDQLLQDDGYHAVRSLEYITSKIEIPEVELVADLVLRYGHGEDWANMAKAKGLDINNYVNKLLTHKHFQKYYIGGNMLENDGYIILRIAEYGEGLSKETLNTLVEHLIQHCQPHRLNDFAVICKERELDVDFNFITRALIEKEHGAWELERYAREMRDVLDESTLLTLQEAIIKSGSRYRIYKPANEDFETIKKFVNSTCKKCLNGEESNPAMLVYLAKRCENDKCTVDRLLDTLISAEGIDDKKRLYALADFATNIKMADKKRIKKELKKSRNVELLQRFAEEHTTGVEKAVLKASIGKAKLINRFKETDDRYK